MNYLDRAPKAAQSADGTDTTDGPVSDENGHILIAGTGRSGTSFLVRYLTELGLDTHISRRGKHAFWDEGANAGFEDLGLSTASEDLPYVVKSPWLYQYIGELVARNAVRIEVVIIPVRNLVDAATSRSLVELQAAHQAAPWLATVSKSWEHWGATPGGSIFSLNPLDQARLLAVGFHILIETLVRADIPILFLEFPRLAEDGAYLFNKLEPWLPCCIREEQALAAHRRIADAKKIRVRRSAKAETTQTSQYPAGPSPIIAYEDHAVLDQLATQRELERLRDIEVKLKSIYASRSWKVACSLRGFASTIRAFTGRR
jgi:hypothetical protein